MFLVRNAKRAYFGKLVANHKHISSVWRALNTFTNGKHSKQTDNPSHLTADAFNDYFLSIADTLVKSQTPTDNNRHYSCSEILVDFCRQKTTGQDAFAIPMMAVHEVGSYVTKMDNKKSSGPDGISNQLLKQSMAYIVVTNTHC